MGKLFYAGEMLNNAHLFYKVICENCSCWKKQSNEEGYCDYFGCNMEYIDYCHFFEIREDIEI